MSAARELVDVSYVPAPERKKGISFRLPLSLLADLDGLVRIWKAQAIARKEDPTNVDRTHVATKLLKDAIAADFDLYGGKPVDDAGWKKLETAIREGVAVATSKQPKK